MSDQPTKRTDETVSLYIGQFQRRHVAYQREHEEELQHTGHDFIARLMSEHMVFGERSAYESLLEGMLNNEERERLHRDQKFTEAWRIFVDMCWTKKQIKRMALILGGILFLIGAIIFVVLAIPQVAGGPKFR